MIAVELLYGLGGTRTAALREPTGADELAVTGADTASAVAFLDRLVVAAPDDELAAGRVANLPTCDRDRLLAALYGALYGDHVEGETRCGDCGEPIAVAFSLRELVAARRPD